MMEDDKDGSDGMSGWIKSGRGEWIKALQIESRFPPQRGYIYTGYREAGFTLDATSVEWPVWAWVEAAPIEVGVAWRSSAWSLCSYVAHDAPCVTPSRRRMHGLCATLDTHKKKLVQ